MVSKKDKMIFHIHTVMMIVITVISNFLNTAVFYVCELFSFITVVICSNQKTFIHMPKVFHILFFFCYLYYLFIISSLMMYKLTPLSSLFNESYLIKSVTIRTLFNFLLPYIIKYPNPTLNVWIRVYI